jgi:hypothetical protein
LLDFGLFGLPFVALVLVGLWNYRNRLAERRHTIQRWILSAAHISE